MYAMGKRTRAFTKRERLNVRGRRDIAAVAVVVAVVFVVAFSLVVRGVGREEIGKQSLPRQ